MLNDTVETCAIAYISDRIMTRKSFTTIITVVSIRAPNIGTFFGVAHPTVAAFSNLFDGRRGFWHRKRVLITAILWFALGLMIATGSGRLQLRLQSLGVELCVEQ